MEICGDVLCVFFCWGGSSVDSLIRVEVDLLEILGGSFGGVCSLKGLKNRAVKGESWRVARRPTRVKDRSHRPFFKLP